MPPALHQDDHHAPHSPWKSLGLVLGPIAALIAYLLLTGTIRGGVPVAGLSTAACACAAVATLMATWWLTEAIPLAATALLPLALFPILNISTMKETAAPYGDEIVFLFLGGFLIQLAMERWGLHRRVALIIMLAVGTGPVRLVGGAMLATAFISMWVSNAAAAAMMLPIGMSLCQRLSQRGVGTGGTLSADTPTSAPNLHPDPNIRHFATSCMIGIAWAATIGGLATPIGTAPNVQLVAYLERNQIIDITFAQWLWIGLPLSGALLLISWLLLTRVFFPIRLATDANAPAPRLGIRDDYRALGPVKPGEWATLAVFLVAVAGWLFQNPIAHALGLTRTRPDGSTIVMLTDAGVAITAGLLLFLIPIHPRRGTFVLDWHWAAKMPFGVLLLFGGGLSLAAAITATGLDRAIAQPLQGLAGTHPILMIIAITAAAVFLSELVSNTALTATLLPIVGSAAAALGIHPALVLIPTALGASAAFMMPAGTPPSAICLSSGYFTIGQMAKVGLVLNLLGIALITLIVYFFAPSALALPR